MFSAILPMVERFLIDVKSTDALQCQLKSQMLDDGDAVALWSGKHIKAVLFPTPESLLKAQSLQPDNPKLFLLINPQWTDGQVISDFGFGRRKEEIESFLREFQDTYFLKSYRIQGRDVRYTCIFKSDKTLCDSVLRRYPDDWCIIVTSQDGQEQCIAQDKTKPSYQRIEAALKDSGLIAGTLFERLKNEFDFNIKSLKQP